MSILQTLTDIVAAGIYFYPVCGQGKLLQIFLTGLKVSPTDCFLVDQGSAKDIFLDSF